MYENYNNGYQNLKEPLVNRLLSAWQQHKKPITIVGVGIGGAWVLTKLATAIFNKIKSNRTEAPNNGVSTVTSTVKATVEAPYESTADLTVENPLDTITDEVIDEELIRMTMSKLGKRSAEKRRLKKLNSE
ncbi:MAG: hypothetical protein ACI9TY_000237 [Alphaproteobacteria bacterium]|jgi:hypothetical protein